MTLNPISIATQGVYSTNRNLGLASKGYIDLAGVAVAVGRGVYKGLYLGLYTNLYLKGY